MTPKQFAALATVAALSLTAAIGVYTARAPSIGDTTAAGKLFPSLAADADKVERVVVTQGGQSLAIEKSSDQWLAKSQDGYPASSEKVRALLAALADATLLEPKTKIPDRYAALEVDDPAGKTSSARLIKLENASGQSLGEIIAGKQRPTHTAELGGKGGNGTYVRRPSEDRSWFASTSINGGAALKDWVITRVFETQTEKIKQLTVEVEGEAPYAIKRNADASHALEAIPAGKKLKYVNLIDNIIEAASFVDFERVRKATGSEGGNAGTIRFETDNGLAIALNVRRDKNAVWVTIDPSGEGDAKKAADDIKARVDGWEFEILPSKADTMLKKQADLLEDIAAANSEPAVPGAGAPPAPPMP